MSSEKFKSKEKRNRDSGSEDIFSQNKKKKTDVKLTLALSFVNAPTIVIKVTLPSTLRLAWDKNGLTNIRSCICDDRILDQDYLLQEEDNYHFLTCFESFSCARWHKIWINLNLVMPTSYLQPRSILHIGDLDVKQIYVRPVYVKFYDIVKSYLDSFDENLFKALRICGSPCIGKTTFLYYLLCQLKLSNQYDRVYLTFGEDHFLFSASGVAQVTEVQCAQPHIYIYDANNQKNSKPLPYVGSTARHIIIASPDLKHIEHVRKVNLVSYYMPLWDRDELLDCRSKLYPTFPKEELETAITKYGHFPPFKRAYEQDSYLDVLRNPAQLGALIARMYQIDEIADEDQHDKVQRIAMIVPDEKFKSYKYNWASDYIKLAVTSKIPALKQAFSTRKKLIDTLSRMEFGSTYEQYVSQIFMSKIFPFQHNYSLLSASSFETEEEPLQIEFPKLVSHIGDDWGIAEAVNRFDTICFPVVSNFPTLDFAIGVNLFQVTLGQRHGVCLTAVETFSRYCASDQHLNLIYVIPSHRKPTFKITNSKKICTKYKIKFWILTLDYPECPK